MTRILPLFKDKKYKFTLARNVKLPLIKVGRWTVRFVYKDIGKHAAIQGEQINKAVFF